MTTKAKERKSWIKFEEVCCTEEQGRKVSGKGNWTNETKLSKKGKNQEGQELVSLILFDILLGKGLVYWEIMQKKWGEKWDLHK